MKEYINLLEEVLEISYIFEEFRSIIWTFYVLTQNFYIKT